MSMLVTWLMNRFWIDLKQHNFKQPTMFQRLDTKDRRKLKRSINKSRFVMEYTDPETKKSMMLYIDTKRKQCMINNKEDEGVAVSELQCMADVLDREIIGGYVGNYPGIHGFFKRKHEKELARMEEEQGPPQPLEEHEVMEEQQQQLENDNTDVMNTEQQQLPTTEST